MHERLMEILVQLLKELDASGDDTIRLKDLSEKLKGQGFSEKELDSALLWLSDRLQMEVSGLRECLPPGRSMRVLHPVERVVITPQAYGYLLHLENAGFLDREQMEVVIEKAMSSGMREVTFDDIKTITASVLFNPDSSDWASRMALWSDDESGLKVQ